MRVERPGTSLFSMASLTTLLMTGCFQSPGGSGLPGDTSGSDTGSAGTVTWYKDIHPFTQTACAGCHFDGSSLSAMSFDSFEQTRAYASVMNTKIVGDTTPTYNMPPFPPPDASDDCQTPGPIKNDPRLTDAQKALFQKWIDEGMPEGDPSTDPHVTPMNPPVLEGDGVLEYPGVNHKVPAAKTDPETGVADIDHTQCFSMNIADAGPVLINALAVKTDPNHPGIVHHVVIGTDPTGVSYTGLDGGDPNDGMFHECETDEIPNSLLLYTYTPGGFPLYFPEDSAYQLDTGARLTFTIHYHRGEADVPDDMTQMVVRYATEKPDYMAYMDRFGGASVKQVNWTWQQRHKDGGWDTDIGQVPFEIKANDADYHMVWREDNAFNDDYKLWSVFPHMHYAGQSIRISVEHADGTETCLAKLDPWDFNWQLTYAYDLPYDQLPTFYGDPDYVSQTDDGPAEGDVVKVDCHYNNTLENIRLRDGLLANGFTQPIDMSVGEGALYEMCVMHYGLILPFDDAPGSTGDTGGY